MSRRTDIAAAVVEVYAWIDAQTALEATSCRACGCCCDFDRFDHRLFLTSVELLYFRDTMPDGRLTPMTARVCPYRVDGRCSVRRVRFAGCRIFSCSAPAEVQSRLSEEALVRLKLICGRLDVQYAYMDLETALNCGGAPENQ